MSFSLILLCAAGSTSSRTGGFPAPTDAVDEGGRRAAGRLELPRRYHAHVVTSPLRTALDTADAMGLTATPHTALKDMDHGAWAGKSFEQVHAENLAALTAWLSDPAQGAPNGETLEMVRRRIGLWLDEQTSRTDPLCAITHAGVIRAALSHCLGISLSATMAIDIAPLSRTLLSFNRIWRLQALLPAD